MVGETSIKGINKEVLKKWLVMKGYVKISDEGMTIMPGYIKSSHSKPRPEPEAEPQKKLWEEEE